MAQPIGASHRIPQPRGASHGISQPIGTTHATVQTLTGRAGVSDPRHRPASTRADPPQPVVAADGSLAHGLLPGVGVRLSTPQLAQGQGRAGGSYLRAGCGDKPARQTRAAGHVSRRPGRPERRLTVFGGCVLAAVVCLVVWLLFYFAGRDLL